MTTVDLFKSFHFWTPKPWPQFPYLHSDLLALTQTTQPVQTCSLGGTPALAPRPVQTCTLGVPLAPFQTCLLVAHTSTGKEAVDL